MTRSSFAVLGTALEDDASFSGIWVFSNVQQIFNYEQKYLSVNFLDAPTLKTRIQVVEITLYAGLLFLAVLAALNILTCNSGGRGAFDAFFFRIAMERSYR
jgi:hypothetical protein